VELIFRLINACRNEIPSPTTYSPPKITGLCARHRAETRRFPWQEAPHDGLGGRSPPRGLNGAAESHTDVTSPEHRTGKPKGNIPAGGKVRNKG
jgi:hypothetical protein